VGDPFKDTSGPSLNILIKLMSMVSVVFAGVTVRYAAADAKWLRMWAERDRRDSRDIRDKKSQEAWQCYASPPVFFVPCVPFVP